MPKPRWAAACLSHFIAVANRETNCGAKSDKPRRRPRLKVIPVVGWIMYYREFHLWLCRLGLALVLFSLPGLQLAKANPAASDDRAPGAAPMEVRYYNRGALDIRHAYKHQLIHLALEATRNEYGDYRIIEFTQEPTSKRQSQLLNKGRELNLAWATPGSETAKVQAIPIEVDILRGLLGMRVCLVNRKAPPLGDIHSLEQLRQLRIGQGPRWPDARIYLNSGITPLESTSFENLFAMLQAKRFDCVPLGANETMQSYRDQLSLYPDLAVEPGLLIYYRYPLYFYVSAKYPRLAERLRLGLDRLQRNGEFMRLFNQHFAADLESLALHQRRIICLASPYADPAQQPCPNPATDLRPGRF